jgi:SAM-dependent methyltransferase
MNHQIIESIELQDWLTTPAGQYLMDWEKEQFERTVSDIFGFHALQLGLPSLEGLASNRMPHKWIAQVCEGGGQFSSVQGANAPPALDNNADQSVVNKYAVVLDSRALPFPDQCLDLILLPHTLEASPDPHATLREVERVLVPEGRIVISGLNPMSLWGVQQKRVNIYRRLGLQSSFLPQKGDFIGYWRLRDWLKLLSFEVEGGRFGCYRPALKTQAWLNRFAWMEKAGDRWWPILGSVYFLVAVKRVRGMKMLSPMWKRPRAINAAAVPSIHSSSVGAAKEPTS